MTDNPKPEHVTLFVESLIEVAAEFAQIMDHMYRHVSDFPDAPPPPIVARDLVAGTLDEAFSPRQEQVESATRLLREARDTIADQIMLVQPGAFDDLEDDDFDDDFSPEFDHGFTESPFGNSSPNGAHFPSDERLH